MLKLQEGQTIEILQNRAKQALMQLTSKHLMELLSYVNAPKPFGHILGMTHLLMSKFCEGVADNVSPIKLSNPGGITDDGKLYMNFRKTFKPRLAQFMQASFDYDFASPISEEALSLALSLCNTVENGITEEKVGHISLGAKILYQWNQNILKVYLLLRDENKEKK